MNATRPAEGQRKGEAEAGLAGGEGPGRGPGAERAMAKHEQPRGPKGLRTRRRILDVTAALLADNPVGDLRVTEIARAANIAQPNFYTYFANVEEAILALAGEISPDSLTVYLEPDWEGEAGVEHARRLVEAAIELWARHGPVFAITSVLADRRRGGFAAVRVRQMRTVYKAFEDKVRKAQAAGRIPPRLTPRMVGYECIAIISSTGQRYDLYRASGFSHEQIVETTARLLHLITTGGSR